MENDNQLSLKRQIIFIEGIVVEVVVVVVRLQQNQAAKMEA